MRLSKTFMSRTLAKLVVAGVAAQFIGGAAIAADVTL